MKLECMTRMRVEPEHPIEAVDVLGDFRLLGQFAWATSRDIVGDHQPERITSRADGTGSPLLSRNLSLDVGWFYLRYPTSSPGLPKSVLSVDATVDPDVDDLGRKKTASPLAPAWCRALRHLPLGQVHIPSSPCRRAVTLSAGAAGPLKRVVGRGSRTR